MIAWTSPARTVRSSPRRISRSPTFAWRFLISSMMDRLPAPRIGNPYQKVNVRNRHVTSNLEGSLVHPGLRQRSEESAVDSSRDSQVGPREGGLQRHEARGRLSRSG